VLVHVTPNHAVGTQGLLFTFWMLASDSQPVLLVHDAPPVPRNRSRSAVRIPVVNVAPHISGSATNATATASASASCARNSAPRSNARRLGCSRVQGGTRIER
jgi:hypothetical protein